LKGKKLNALTRTAALAALTAAATMAVPVPLPGGGYANAGDVLVLLGAFVLGPGLGAAAAGIGSALSDLILGYAFYAPGTLIIKAADAAAAGAIFLLLKRKIKVLPAAAVSGIAGEIVMVLGYFGYEALILQSGTAAAVGMVPNLLQGAVGVVGSSLLLPAVKKIAENSKGET
jgi:uncharacterized membrane protein